jgi:hypothetical protein
MRKHHSWAQQERELLPAGGRSTGSRSGVFRSVEAPSHYLELANLAVAVRLWRNSQPFCEGADGVGREVVMWLQFLSASRQVSNASRQVTSFS